MKSWLVSIWLLSLVLTFPVKGQGADSLQIENIPVDTAHFTSVMESDPPIKTEKPVVLEKTKFSPNPTKAVLYSAIFPGLGQIYNRKYWKLPIVYGGLMGCAYAISFNNRYYRDYSNAYLDLMDDDPSTDSYRDFVSSSYVISDTTQFANTLKRKKDFYRRYRDLSYIITVGLYVICMIDAYVDAQLFDFDISPDLSLRVEPAIFEPTRYNRRGFGIQCSLNF